MEITLNKDPFYLYISCLKNWEFDKEALSGFLSGASDHCRIGKARAKTGMWKFMPMQSKTNSSSNLCMYIGPEIEPCPCLEMHREAPKEKGFGDWLSKNKEQILYGAIFFVALSIFVHLNDVQNTVPIETKNLELPMVETSSSQLQLPILALKEAKSEATTEPTIEGSDRTQFLIKGLAAKLFFI